MQRVKIVHDNTAESPRESHEHLGTMACWHRRYNLGDEHMTADTHPDDFVNSLPKGTVVLDLYLMDHSGLTISTRHDHFRAVDPTNRWSVNGKPGGWDWGWVGVIYATPEKIREAYITKRITAAVRIKAIECLVAEVEEYDLYLRGETYGFVIEDVKTCSEGHEHATEVESVWGFIGADVDENGMLDYIPDELHKSAREAMKEPVFR